MSRGYTWHRPVRDEDGAQLLPMQAIVEHVQPLPPDRSALAVELSVAAHRAAHLEGRVERPLRRAHFRNQQELRSAAHWYLDQAEALERAANAVRPADKRQAIELVREAHGFRRQARHCTVQSNILRGTDRRARRVRTPRRADVEAKG